MNEDREYWISLPESYSNEGSSYKRYPVLIVLDGNLHFKAVAGMVSYMSSGLNGSWKIPEMIVVAIQNVDRRGDYTPDNIIVENLLFSQQTNHNNPIQGSPRAFPNQSGVLMNQFSTSDIPKYLRGAFRWRFLRRLAFFCTITLGCLLFCVKYCPAQTLTLSAKHYGIKEGLSHRQANAIYQDQQGFIWIGTDYGLNRFDGYQFRWWTEEKDGLSSNKVNAITQDAAGRLWVVCHQSNPKAPFFHISSISLLDPESDKVSSFAETIGKELPVPLKNIYADFRLTGPDRSIYMGTSDQARLIRYHPSVGFQIIPIQGYQSFFPVARTPEGQFWGLCDKYFLVKVDSQGTPLDHLKFDEALKHTKIAFDGIHFWIQLGGENTTARFRRINTETGRVDHLTPGALFLPAHLTQTGYNRIQYDEANDLIWCINLTPHIAAFQGESFRSDTALNEEITKIVKEKIGLPKCYFIDRAGAIWIGGDFGLAHFAFGERKFEQLLYTPDPEKFRDQFACRGILKIGQKLVVYAENKGLHVIDLVTKEEKQVEPPSPIAYNAMNAFALEREEESAIWTAGSDVYRVNLSGGEEAFERIGEGNVKMVVWAIKKDQNGRIWLGTQAGLRFLDPGNRKLTMLEVPEAFEALKEARIINLLDDPTGHIWICSNKGLFELDPEKGIVARYWKDGPIGYQLPHDDIRYVHRSRAGTYWLATGGGGLIRWDRENHQWKQFTRADGLSNNNLYAVYEDKRGRLWLSSDLGIMRFDKETFRVQAYLEEDGITDNEFNRASHYQDPITGRIYFGGLNGITAFDPEQFYQNEAEEQPPLVVTGFQQFDGRHNKLANKKGDLLRENKITLRPNDRFLKLSFALLSYNNPEQTLYAYQIEGWMDEWEYQKENSIHLGRLPYGTHTLSVKAQGANGHWSTQMLEIPIKVLRPFYLSAWFLALMSGLAILILYGVYRYNFRRQLALQEAQQLRELDQLKTQFYSNITHEFRTPLTVIQGISDQIEGYDKERSLIRRNSQRLLKLINQMLDLSKLESNKLSLHLVKADIIPYLRYLTESLHSLAEVKGIELGFQPDVQEYVMDFDEEKIQQVIYNLFSNALKFTEAGGTVFFRVKEKLVVGEPMLELQIQDTGRGISADALPHIFDRFYQADVDRHSHQSEGTGIGLALARELVLLMGGTITVKSALEKGTTFTVLLPAVSHSYTPVKTSRSFDAKVPAHKASTDQQSVKQEPTTGKTNTDQPLVLIVEDNHDVTIYIETILKDKYQTRRAANGQQGIDMALTLVPDLIITDVMMPQKDGYELCEVLKTDERTCHIPIVMLTAKATQADRLAGLKTGADAYLMKPFNKEELFVRLDKLISLRQALQKFYLEKVPVLVSASPPDKNQPAESSLDEQFLQKIGKIIEDKIGDADLDIDYLCRAVHLSSTQLHRKMKALTGTSPIRFIRKVRLHKSRVMLETTDRSIAEVAYDLGFTDPNYFSRAFSKEFGHTPSSLRS